MKPDSPSNNSPDQKSSSLFLPLPEGYLDSVSDSLKEILLEGQEIARGLEELAAERAAQAPTPRKARKTR